MGRWIGVACRVAACLLALACQDAPPGSDGPRARIDPAYARDSACAGCHPDAAAAFRGSHHDLAMQPATAETVLGDFSDARFGDGPGRTRFFRRGDRFLVQTPGRDGRQALFEVTHVFGVDPLQQLLVALPGGRLQAFPIAWDTRPRAAGGQRWFTLAPDDPPPPGDPFHWTGVYQTWNHQCASCHSTAVVRGFDEAASTYATTWAEIDVGCQACHGAGAAHVKWAEGAGGRRDLAPLTGANQIDACGPCHARRAALVADAVPGGPLLDRVLPATPVPPLYHADGQIRAEVYVLGSFLQSRMAAAGVTCTDCHDPHRGSLRRPGNRLCLGCHGASPPAAFAPRLPAGRAYDTPVHHHHAVGSEAAQCVTCHMPTAVYMGIDARRDHSFRIPDPAGAARIGAPDPCTTCHADRGAPWAAAALARWFGPERRRNPGAILTAPDPETARAYARDPAKPAILRAAVLDRLGRTGRADPATVAAAAADADPWVRVLALRAGGGLPPNERIPLLRAGLDDPIRAVRLEASRALAAVPDAMLGGDAALRDTVLDEFEAMLRASADTPSAQYERAQLAEQRGHGDPDALYRATLLLDPGFEPAARRLAHRLAERGEPAKAEPLLRRALDANPESGLLHYDLGLLVAELGRTREALPLLDRAVALQPANPRIYFNLGLVLEQLGQSERAEAAFAAGIRVAPAQPDLLYAMIAFQMNRGEAARALPYAEHLDRVAATPESAALLGRVRAAAAAATPPADPDQL